MDDNAIELGVGDVVRLGDVVVRVRSIVDDVVTFDVWSESDDPDEAAAALRAIQAEPPSRPRHRPR